MKTRNNTKPLQAGKRNQFKTLLEDFKNNFDEEDEVKFEQNKTLGQPNF